MTQPTRTQRSRLTQLEHLGNTSFDVLVLGGGISGVATARELTKRGYRTALIDDHDFASGTSQESSQLIWGGLKYLQQGHVKLVFDLCYDRNTFIRQYPDRIEPLRFVYPHFSHDPHAMITIMAGVYAYHVLGRAFDVLPRRLRNAEIKRLVPLVRSEIFSDAVEYSEGRMIVSDARLTLDLLFDAMDAGLIAANYVSFRDINWRNAESGYEIHAEDTSGSARFSIRTKWIVNTTGPWADDVNRRLGIDPPFRHLFSRGAHIIVPKIDTNGRALTCLAKDGRIFFVIPWGEVTMIGTTDAPFEEPATRLSANDEEINYLRSECESKFRMKLNDDDILNSKCGLRPLLRPANLRKEDFLSLSRSHKVWSDERARITVLWGGKYTNSLGMASEIADQVRIQPMGTPRLVLPDGQGRISDAFLQSASTPEAALTEACRNELVVTLEDLLRRRTNIALKVAQQGRGKNGENAGQMQKLEHCIERVAGSHDPSRRSIG